MIGCWVNSDMIVKSEDGVKTVKRVKTVKSKKGILRLCECESD